MVQDSSYYSYCKNRNFPVLGYIMILEEKDEIAIDGEFLNSGYQGGFRFSTRKVILIVFESSSQLTPDHSFISARWRKAHKQPNQPASVACRGDLK
ncbi:hypothetical protein SDJN02_04638, partial [Cucurbita argyrosperma subsp. argyrosperma]